MSQLRPLLFQSHLLLSPPSLQPLQPQRKLPNKLVLPLTAPQLPLTLPRWKQTKQQKPPKPLLVQHPSSNLRLSERLTPGAT